MHDTSMKPGDTKLPTDRQERGLHDPGKEFEPVNDEKFHEHLRWLGDLIFRVFAARRPRTDFRGAATSLHVGMRRIRRGREILERIEKNGRSLPS
jgi:hypothetical protein